MPGKSPDCKSIRVCLLRFDINRQILYVREYILYKTILVIMHASIYISNSNNSFNKWQRINLQGTF
jgi:hypothetical protein